jgi:long-chain acyl-CoA synthetase
MKGYWNMPEATADVITDDGWLKTGDAGYVKGEYVYLFDRVKDMVVSGGENVYPAEIENVLMSHPDIADAAVIGVPDPKWGETVKAIVVKAEGKDPSERDVIDFARERLAHYKCPTSVDFVDGPLPRNPSGKLLKRVLREPYWEGQERRIH